MTLGKVTFDVVSQIATDSEYYHTTGDFSPIARATGWSEKEYLDVLNTPAPARVLPLGFTQNIDCGENENWTDEQGNMRGGYQHGCETWFFAPNGERYVLALYPPTVLGGRYARQFISLGDGTFLIPYALANKIGGELSASHGDFVTNWLDAGGAVNAAMGAFVFAGLSGGLDAFAASSGIPAETVTTVIDGVNVATDAATSAAQAADLAQQLQAAEQLDAAEQAFQQVQTNFEIAQSAADQVSQIAQDVLKKQPITPDGEQFINQANDTAQNAADQAKKVLEQTPVPSAPSTTPAPTPAQPNLINPDILKAVTSAGGTVLKLLSSGGQQSPAVTLSPGGSFTDLSSGSDNGKLLGIGIFVVLGAVILTR